MVTFKLTTLNAFLGVLSQAPLGVLHVESSNELFWFGSKIGGQGAVVGLFAKCLLSKAEFHMLFKEIGKSDLPETLHPEEGCGESDKPIRRDAGVDYRQYFSGFIN